jgi:hypothetical protein
MSLAAVTRLLLVSGRDLRNSESGYCKKAREIDCETSIFHMT